MGQLDWSSLAKITGCEISALESPEITGTVGLETN